MPADQTRDLDELDQLRSQETGSTSQALEPWEPVPWEPEERSMEDAAGPLLPPEDSAILRRAAEGVDRLQALLDEEERDGEESPLDTMLRLLEEMLATQKAIVETTRLHREETAALGLRLSALETRLPSKAAVAPSTASAALPETSEETPPDTSEIH